jgi:hypothetical protein
VPAEPCAIEREEDAPVEEAVGEVEQSHEFK